MLCPLVSQLVNKKLNGVAIGGAIQDMDGGFVEGVDVEGPTFVSKALDSGFKNVSYQNEGELSGHEEMSNHDPNLNVPIRTP